MTTPAAPEWHERVYLPDGWWHSADRRQWEHVHGHVITDMAIVADRTRHPRFVPPAPQPTLGERVLGFAYGSAEARRQKLDGALYYQAVDAILRAERRAGPRVVRLAEEG